MDTLEFIADLVEDLVWPLTLVLCIFVFRGPISNLLPFVQRLRYKDFVVEFSQKLDQVETQAAAIAGKGAEVGVPDDMLELAQTILGRRSIRLEIEKAIREVAASREMESPSSVPYLLRENSHVPLNRRSVLRDLRPEVVHRLDVPLTPEMARHYASAARVVVLEELSAPHRLQVSQTCD